MSKAERVSEKRTEHLLIELLRAQGWDDRKPAASATSLGR